MGIIIFFLAVVAVVIDRSTFVKILGTVSLVTLFMSFGRHLPFLSNLLLNYLPGFNKFRVPAMILVIVQFSAVILAGFGLRAIIEKRNDPKSKFFPNLQKTLYAFLIIFVLFFILQNNLQKNGFVKDGDASRYSAQQLKQLKAVRAEKMQTDGIQTGLMLLVVMGLTLLYGNKKLGKYPYLLLVMIIVILDLSLVDKRFLQDITPQKVIDKTYSKTQADAFLEKDKEVFRIYPLAREFGQNQWAYFNQTIGGYHGAKLKRYQEIIDNCLNYEFQNRIPINWNIVNMLNAKYVIFPDQLPLENLEYAFYDRKQKQTIYKNTTYLPRAWFVNNVEKIEKKEDIWKRLNQQQFDPATMAIVEKDVPAVKSPGNSSVSLTDFGLHNLNFDVKTDSTAFLTISEVYYPAGWKAYVDGKETEIFATNYILRGIVVPAGEHKIEMIFAPPVYKLSLKLSLIGSLLTIIFIIIGLIFYIKQNYKGEIIYVLKK